MKQFVLVLLFLLPLQVLGTISDDAIVDFNFSGYTISFMASRLVASGLLSQTLSNTQAKKDNQGRYFIECDRSLVDIAHYFLVHKKLLNEHNSEAAWQAAEFFKINEMMRYLTRNYEPVA